MDDNYSKPTNNDFALKENQLDDQPDSTTAIESEMFAYEAKQKKCKNSLKGGFKRKFGPIGLVVGLLGGSFIGFSSLMTPAVAINHFVTAITDKFNVQEVPMSARTLEVLSSKKTSANEASHGTASNSNTDSNNNNQTTTNNVNEDPEIDDSKSGYIKKRNKRFNTISNDLKQRMELSGLKAETIKNDNFKDNYYTDGDLRMKVNEASKGSFGRLDETEKTVFDVKEFTRSINSAIHLGLKVTKGITNVKDALSRRLNSSIRGDNISKNAITGTSSVKIKNQTADQKQIQQDVSKELDDGVKHGKSLTATGAFSFFSKSVNAISLVTNTGDICNVFHVVNTAIAITKSENAMQLIRFAVSFLKVADRIKAGDASEEEISFIGNKLLQMIPKSDGSIRTAMDSTGFVFASQNKLETEINSDTDPSAAQFQNAANGPISQIYNFIKESVAKKAACSNVVNTINTVASILQVGIAIVNVIIAVGTGGLSTFVTILTNYGVSFIVGKTIQMTTQQALKNLSDYLSREILASLTGLKVSDETEGEDAGNAITSGASNFFSKIAASSGAGPMTINAAIAAAAANEKLIALKAADERAKKSLFDVSSPYTFLGSIIYRAWPYYTKTINIFDKIGAIFGLARSSLNELLLASQALATASSTLAYQQCQDVEYRNLKDSYGNQAAFDIFCNPVHGIPIAALFTKSQATALKLDSPAIMVADNNNQTSATSFAGEYFSAKAVNTFFDNLNQVEKDAIFKDSSLVRDIKKNPLWNYYKQCVDRKSIPFGASFSKQETGDQEEDNSHNTNLATFFNIKTKDYDLTDGSECILSNDNLITGKGKPGEVEAYTEMGKRVMYALFFMDERSQCILDDGKGCQTINRSKSNNDKEDGSSNTTGDQEITEGDGYTIIYPSTEPSSRRAILWLSGSGEKGKENNMKTGLARYAKENPDKVSEIIIIPHKDTPSWSINKVVESTNKAIDEITKKGYDITALDGWGFSAGANGICSTVTSNQVKLDFRYVFILSGTVGSGNMPKLAEKLNNGTLEHAYFYTGDRDNANSYSKEANELKSKSSQDKVSFEAIDDTKHEIYKVVAYVKENQNND